jgi:hypothetical protein
MRAPSPSTPCTEWSMWDAAAVQAQPLRDDAARRLDAVSRDG